MRSHPFRISALAASAILAAGGAVALVSPRAQAGPSDKAQLTQGFTKGAWDHKSIGPLAFSPSGVLFFADDQAGAIYGVDLGEKPSSGAAHYSKVADLGSAIAARLGTTAAGIQIKDVAVSPISHNLYLSVRKTDGADQNPANAANYALFSVDPSGKVGPVDLTERPHGRAAIATTAGQRENQPRVADIAYANGRVLAAALSTEAFKSNLVSVPVPFKAEGAERYATSIYHVSHKRQETASPIQTLTVYRDGDKEYLMAAYICTPVVRFNLDELKPGATVTGITVAELGSQNRPMDMIAYGKSGEQSLLLNNSSFGVVKVGSKIALETAAVNEKTTADRGGQGKTPYPGIDPVDSLKGAQSYAAAGDTLLVIRKTEGGMALEPMPLP
jgi:hypothetical protein